MALKIVRRKSPSVAPTSDKNKVDTAPTVEYKLEVPVGEPSYTITTGGVPCTVHLAWNNSQDWKMYSVWCKDVWVGSIRTAGGEQVSCKALVPKDYTDLLSEPRMTPTACSMMDACYLLLKHAGVLPNDPKPSKRVALDLSEYNIPF